MDEGRLARDLITADDPLAVLSTALNQVWQADDVDDVNAFFTKRERETNRLERFALETFFDVYDLLLARIRQERQRSRFEGANGPLIILDGCSIREANLLIGRLQEAGYRVTDYSYALSEVPSGTMAFNRSAFGTARVASLRQWREYQVVSIQSAELPVLLPAVSDVLVWISYPDELLHKVRGEAVTPQEAFDRTVKVLLATLDTLEADEFLVTSEHGYLYVENATLLCRRGGTRRCYVSFLAGDGCYVRGRYHWSVQGPASDVAHGGLSLMECLVPVMRIARKK